jgi:hypothetical protein
MVKMWVVFAAAAALLGAPASAQSSGANDRVDGLIGSWSCNTGRGNVDVDTYTRSPDGSIAYTFRYHAPAAAASEPVHLGCELFA